MTTANLLLDLPTVSVTIGPTWASKLNTALELVDAHDHSSGKGVKVTPAGLDITADLDLQENNLDDARSLRLANSTSTLDGAADVRCVYVYNGELYYNNSAGTQVQLTAGGQVNAGSASTSVHTQTTVASNTAIQASDSFVTLLVNTATTRTITLPAANSVSAGRFYVVIDATGSAGTNNITLARTGSDTVDGTAGSVALGIDRGVWVVESDGVSKWHLSRGAPSFLTRSALTLVSGGSVTIGSGATLSESSVAIGTSSLSTSALTVGDSSVATSGLSVGPSPASDGHVRLPNESAVRGRNAFDNGDVVMLALDASDVVSLGDGGAGVTITGPVTAVGALTATGDLGGANVGAASGIATLDGSAQLTSTQRAGWMVGTAYQKLATTFSTSSTSYTNVTGLSATLSCVAGDILIVDASLLHVSADFTWVKIMVNDGGGDVDPSEFTNDEAGSVFVRTALHFVYTVANTGDVTVRAQVKVNTGSTTVYGTSSSNGPSAIRLIQLRP